MASYQQCKHMGSDGSTESTRSCSDSSYTAPTAEATAAAQLIQRKLVVLLGFWVISASVLSQLFPSVVLAHFNHDDAKTASFLGWVNGVSSLLQFLVLPSLSASVDITGRKRMLIISAAAQAAAAAAWGCAPSNIVLATLTSVRAHKAIPFSLHQVLIVLHCGTCPYMTALSAT
jgi:MFS family permease